MSRRRDDAYVGLYALLAVALELAWLGVIAWLVLRAARSL